MSIPAARPGLDLHRRSYFPVPEPPTLPHFTASASPIPLSTICVPTLSDISEEHSSTESHIYSLDGAAEDFSPSVPASKAAQQQRRRRDRLKPGFRNAPPFRVFVRRNWLDIVTQLVCLLVAWAIYLLAKPLLPRYFPLYPGIGTSAWGIKYGKPLLKEYVSTPVSAAVSFVVPLVVMGAFGLWGTREFWESNAAVCPSPPPNKIPTQQVLRRQIMGLGYALSSATLLQCFLKWFIGGLRPHFLSACQPRTPPLTQPSSPFDPAA
jgi:diacylglycerol diphosphate phosphatase/phosphatidate phosphatase